MSINALDKFCTGYVLNDDDFVELKGVIEGPGGWQDVFSGLSDSFISLLAGGANTTAYNYITNTTFNVAPNYTYIFQPPGGNDIVSPDGIKFLIGKGLYVGPYTDVNRWSTLTDIVAILGTAAHEYTHGFVTPDTPNTSAPSIPPGQVASEFFGTLTQVSLLAPQGLTATIDSLTGTVAQQQYQFSILQYWQKLQPAPPFLIFNLYASMTQKGTVSTHTFTRQDWLKVFSIYPFPEGTSANGLCDIWGLP